MSVIVLEGIDGAGKSTLAENIKKLAPVKTIIEHRGPLKGSVEEELLEPLQDLPTKTLMVCDRWHVGEMVYGPIYRGQSKVAGVWEKTIERTLDKMGAVKVIVAPALTEVKKRLDVRGEDYLQPEHVEQVYTAYKDFQAANPSWLLIESSDEATAQHLIDLALGK